MESSSVRPAFAARGHAGSRAALDSVERARCWAQPPVGLRSSALEVSRPLPDSPLLGRSVIDLFDAAAAEVPDGVFYTSRSLAGEDYTFARFAEDARAVGRALVARGIRPGDRVLVLSENRPRWSVAWAGIAYAGGVAVSLESQLTAEGVAGIALDCGARAALVSAEMEPKLEAAFRNGLEFALSLDDAGDDGASAHTPWSELLRDAPDVALPAPAASDDPAAMLYTSGTTGAPKGVVLTHGNIQAERVAVAQAVEASQADVLLMFLPMHHILSQLGALFIPAALRTRVVHAKIASAEDLLAAIREEGVTIVLAVPLLYHRIHARIEEKLRALATPARWLVAALMGTNGWLRSTLGLNAGRRLFRSAHAIFGPSVRLMVSGGSPLDPRVQRDLFRLGFTVAVGYGLTECTGAATLTPLERIELGSVGQPVAGATVRIESPDGDGVGEVWLRGPIVMSGYHGRPQANAEVFSDGWLRTGDLGRLDAGGNLFLTGRIKELIVLSNGKNVYPEDTETHYSRSPFIEELCVVALDEGAESERLHAVIVPEWDALAREGVSSVREHVRAELLRLSAELPAWQRVLSFELSREPLPRTSTRKLQRFLVRADAGAATAPEGADRAVAPEDPAAVARIASPAGRAIAALAEERAGDATPVRPSSHLELDLGLDSLRRVEFLMGVEARLGVAIDAEAAQGIQTVDDLIAYVEECGAGTGPPGAEATAPPFARLVAEAGDDDLPAWLRRGRGPVSRALFAATLFATRAVSAAFFRLSVGGREHLDTLPDGPFLLCPNHQSFLDSALVACVLPRRVAARAFALGHSRYVEGGMLGAVGRFYATVPTDADRNLKHAMTVGAAGLKAGRPLLVFPEGTRSVDGTLHEVKLGAPILAVELDLPLVPVRIEGAFEAWPRGRRLPRPGRVRVTFDAPILPAAVAGGARGEAAWRRVHDALVLAYLRLGVPAGEETALHASPSPSHGSTSEGSSCSSETHSTTRSGSR